jgi:hypothetical protein
MIPPIPKAARIPLTADFSVADAVVMMGPF